MTGWQTTWEVARWEFRRFFKPKQILISLVMTLVFGALGFGVARFIDRADEAPVTLAVIGGERLGLGADTLAGRLVVQPRNAADEAVLRAAVAERELGGLLVVHDASRADLVVRRSPSWQPLLRQELTAAAHQVRLAESGIDAGRLQAILAPLQLEVQRTTGAGAGRGEILLTGALLFLSFIGVMTGMGFIFAGITGEKQQRVTEQVVSAIPPQAWIDGKIVGLAGVAIVNTLATGLAFGALFAAIAAASGRMPSLPSFSLERPFLVPLLVLLPLLGFVFWFAVLCAVAATIDDPHTSTKGSLLMLPMLPVAVAGLLIARADTPVAQFFGVFPVTSPTVLPVRLLLAEVAAWEVPVALMLLLASIWLLRRAAGKIFALGMLMYGKEPSLREIWRWARAA